MTNKTATRKGVVPQGDVTPRALTPKQLRFVDEYLVDLNAAAAARRAGYSLKTAEQMGYENLGKPQIASAIEAKRKELATATGITRERILKEMEKIAFSDPRQLFDDLGRMVPVHELSDAAAGAIASIEIESHVVGKPGEDGTVKRVITTKVKAWDKGKQLENLLKHLGMDADRPAVPDGQSRIPNYDVLDAKFAKFRPKEAA